MSDKDFAEALSSRGVRPTQQRVAVYKYLMDNHNHPSADTIYRELSGQFPVFSRTTIYNTLNSLLDAGLIRLVSITPEEQRFDADTADHGHFHCDTCGMIADFPLDEGAVRAFCPQECAYSQGDVFIRGRCASCRTQTEAALQ